MTGFLTESLMAFVKSVPRRDLITITAWDHERAGLTFNFVTINEQLSLGISFKWRQMKYKC